MLNFIRTILLYLRYKYLKLSGVNIDKTARVSLKAKIDFTNPRGVVISEGAYIAFGAVILTHDFVRALHTKTVIGKNSFIGANSIILPGICIGEQVIVAAGSVVTKDVLPNSIVAGNPAKIIRTGILTSKFGQLVN